jgi:hypothetical protein
MKSHGSSLWITGPQLALAPWWTRDHGAAWPLRSSGGHHDSSERERERSSELSPMVSLGGRATAMVTRLRSTEAPDGASIRWGDGFECEEERLEAGWVQWIMWVLSLCLL